MGEVKILTGTGDFDWGITSIVLSGPLGTFINGRDIYQITVNDLEESTGVPVSKEAIFESLSEFFDVDIVPKNNEAPDFGTGIHETLIAFENNWLGRKTANAWLEGEKESGFPQVGDEVTEYWQLERARKADAVLMDVEGDIWALDTYAGEEGRPIDWVVAVDNPLPHDAPDSLYITDVFPAKVIYIRGQIGAGDE